MNNCRNITKLFHNLLVVLFKYWAFFLVGSSIFLILIVTLYPYTFISYEHLSLIVVQFRQSLNLTTDIYDAIANILLFSSLGFGLAGIFYKRFSGWRFIVFLNLIISASLSLTIETLQLFLPTRTSSVLDLLTNILGGFLGTVAFYFCKSFAVKFLVKRWLTKSRLIFIAISYTTLVFCLMFSLHRSNNLSNWDPTFPLLVGNESTGDRPWNGMMSQIYFANRALSTAEITQVLTEKHVRDSSTLWTTAYQLTGKNDYLDQNDLSPNLEWRGYPPDHQNKGMISLSQKHWLSTLEPVTKLIQSIRQTSQFSLLTTVATSDIHQTGPARIISLSANPSLRNLTIGQQGSRLIVRLRTPLSGAGKSNTNLAFSGIFTDTNFHRLLLNFNRNTLQLFVDNSQEIYVIRLSPAILFAHLLPAIGIRNLQITPSNEWILQLIFYSFILSLPAALLLLKIDRSY